MHNIYKYQIGGLTRMDLSSSSIDFSSISPLKLNIEGLAIKNKRTKWFKLPEVQQGFSLLGQASGGISSLFQDKLGYSGEYGSLLQVGDLAFDQASDTVMAINPVVGGIMKAGGLVSDLLTTYGGMGTDSMTKKDAILGSKLLSLTPLGMINGFFGDTTDTISKDNEAFEIVGAAYGGTNSAVDNAVNKSGKKYGFFSRDEMTEANAEIAKAKVQLNRMADIASEAMNRLTLKEAMASINGLGTQYNMLGGYNQYTTRIGKHGMSLDLITKAKNIVKESRVLLKGGQIEDPFKKYLSTLSKSLLELTNFRRTSYKDIPLHKNGGSIIDLTIVPTEILLINPNEIPEFLEGGSINVIPEGALHARKHNMDMEGITKKGIPVVADKENGEIEQQAEIEKEEIIFRLEVTKKLEELEKKYYNSDTSLKEKDELALEAGKLLVDEILYNTIDNVNLIDRV